MKDINETIDCVLVVFLVAFWVTFCSPTDLGPLLTFLLVLFFSGLAIWTAERWYRNLRKLITEEEKMEPGSTKPGG